MHESEGKIKRRGTNNMTQLYNSQKILISRGIHPFTQRVAAHYLQHWTKVYADSSEIPQPLLHSGHYFQIPKAEDPAFIHEVLKRCLDLQVQYFLPMDKEEAITLSGAKVLFDEYGITILAPSPEILKNNQALIHPPREQQLMLFINGKSESTGMEEANIPKSGLIAKSENGAYFPCFAS